MNRLVDKAIKRFFFRNAWNVVMRSSQKVHCSFCQGDFVTFLIGGVAHKRANAQCPKCNALERHRLMWHVLSQNKMLHGENIKMLHVAPEKLFYNFFSAQPNIDYVPCAKFGDGFPDKYPENTIDRDLTDMPEDDNSYDAIICSHVLEHIPDDHLAMKEMCRILRPGGWAILQVPLDRTRKETYEDWNIIDPQEREIAFGQTDHVRVYGSDYKDRLEKAGFEVDLLSPTENMTNNEIIRYGFLHEDVYIGRKS